MYYKEKAYQQKNDIHIKRDFTLEKQIMRIIV